MSEKSMLAYRERSYSLDGTTGLASDAGKERTADKTSGYHISNFDPMHPAATSYGKASKRVRIRVDMRQDCLHLAIC